ncbi:hypothetical protein IPV09_01460 [Tessaracoccus sp. SD287]|uniref:hypothetical protein n=1 Tax=Tessaracoccus sp. SD287 TaxID=2782008 RepID=UPI001A964759|nr:hypothetical protein [Tessaracoccus sp. SD287]MBO1029999.1 hypothetical protein [Tessaracoccus sp. SD287]
MGTPFLLLTGVVWATAGNLIQTRVQEPADGGTVRALTALGWALLWPVLLVVNGGTRTVPGVDEQESVEYESDPVRIAELERELGLALPEPTPPAPAPDPAPLAPPAPTPRRTPAAKQLPQLAGTSASACTLPTFETDNAFDDAYGITLRGGENRDNLAELTATLADLASIPTTFLKSTETHTGPEILGMAEVSLRRIGRIEGSLTPLFAGLTFADYGRARKGCIQARAAIGDVLDTMALSGRL